MAAFQNQIQRGHDIDAAVTEAAPAQSGAPLAQAIVRNVEQVLQGKHLQVEWALAAMVASGHVLLEDVPGLGKTMLARALATSVGLSFKRSSSRPT